MIGAAPITILGGSAGGGSSFKTIQTPTGTSPVATSPTDILTLTSTDLSVTIRGTAASDTIDFSAAGAVPIGAIIAFQTHITGTPTLSPVYMECNGATITDLASPMHGQATPSINTSTSFLRGQNTSGGTGGSATHDHTLGALCIDPGTFSVVGACVDLSVLNVGPNFTTVNVDMGSAVGVVCADLSFLPSGLASANGGSITGCGNFGGGTTDPASNVPPYYDVIYIIRIK